jgi:hypothetical protein
VIRLPRIAARRATSGALRRQAVNVGTPFEFNDRLLPFGEGKTNSVSAGMERRDAGESEYSPGTHSYWMKKRI